MGIGAALAMGLVQGFTRNIQTEQARRQAEDERANAYQDMIIKAIAEGKATEEGISSVQSMINDYKDKLDKRGPIGPFGRAADAVTMDMSNIQTALTSADDVNFTIKGNKHSVGFSLAQDVNDAPGILSELAGKLQDTNFVSKLKEDQLLYQKIVPLVSNSQYEIIADAHKAWMAGTKTNSFVSPDVFGTTANPIYPGLNVFAKIGIESHGMQPNSFGKVNSQIASQTGVQTSNDFDFVGSDVKVNEDGSVSVSNVEIPKEMVPFYDNIAKQLALADPRITKDKVYNFFTGVGDDGMTLGFGQQLFGVPGALSPEQKVQALNASMFIAQAFTEKGQPVDGLDPDKGLYRMNNDAVLFAQSIIDSSEAKTFEQAVMAIAPYMRKDKLMKSVNRPFYEVEDMGLTREAYALMRKYGSGIINQNKVGESAKFTIGYFIDQHELRKKAAAELDRLANITLSRENEPEVYAQFKKALGVWTGEGGIFQAIMGDVFGVSGFEKETAMGGDLNLQVYDERVEALRGKKGKDGTDLAELEALRISLAFQLARAADPSGRLSNQDIEQQLARLGAGFQTKEQALAKIKVVRDEINLQIRKDEVLLQYGRGSSTLSEMEARVMDAAIVVDTLSYKSDAIRKADQQGADVSQLAADDVIFSADNLSTRKGPNGEDVYFSLRNDGNYNTNANGDQLYQYKDADGKVQTVTSDRLQARSAPPAPDNTAPDNTVPDNTAPDNTVPDNTTPDNTTPAPSSMNLSDVIEGTDNPMYTFIGTNSGGKVKNNQTNETLDGRYMVDKDGYLIKLDSQVSL